MKRRRILVVDDEPGIRQSLSGVLAVSYTHLDVYKRQQFRAVD